MTRTPRWATRAKALEAEVTAVCSTAKVDLVSSIGSDHVIDYRREDVAERKHHYDVILDVGGNSSLSRLRRALTPKGKVVIAGGETDGRWLGGFDRQIRAKLLSPFVGQTLTMFISLGSRSEALGTSGVSMTSNRRIGRARGLRSSSLHDGVE